MTPLLTSTMPSHDNLIDIPCHPLFFQGPSNVDAITTLVELGADLQPVLDQANVETPLHVAARSGRVQSIERLLACRVPVMLRTKDGSTALHYAAAFGQTHVLEVGGRLTGVCVCVCVCLCCSFMVASQRIGHNEQSQGNYNQHKRNENAVLTALFTASC